MNEETLLAPREVLNWTEPSRIKIWRLLCVIGWTEAFIGLVLAIIVSQPLTILIDQLPKCESHLIAPFLLEIVIGFTVVVICIHGVITSQSSLYNPYMKGTNPTHNVWFVVGILQAVFMVIALIFLPTSLIQGNQEFLLVLRSGMSHYLTNIKWKRSIDSLQQKFKCCGVYKLEDWTETNWIPADDLRPQDMDVENILTEDGVMRARVIPPSCCNPEAREPCFHDILQQNNSKTPPNFVLNPDTVFKEGCSKPISQPMTSTVAPFKALSIVIILLQIVQLVIGKCLHLSAQGRSTAINSTLTEPLRKFGSSITLENEAFKQEQSETGSTQSGDIEIEANPVLISLDNPDNVPHFEDVPKKDEEESLRTQTPTNSQNNKSSGKASDVTEELSTSGLSVVTYKSREKPSLPLRKLIPPPPPKKKIIPEPIGFPLLVNPISPPKNPPNFSQNVFCKPSFKKPAPENKDIDLLKPLDLESLESLNRKK